MNVSTIQSIVLLTSWKWVSKEVSDVQHMIRALMRLADNAGPDQPAYTYSQIWTFFVSQHILQYPLIL